ncbi:MAG: DNA gyrase inhibitor YacG [Burkholderiales bacterium]
MASPDKKPIWVRCPACGKSSTYTPTNRFRPFCSERCKMVDLGAWATESYRVPLEDEPVEDDSQTSRLADRDA